MIQDILFFCANALFVQALSVKMIGLILAADSAVLIIKLMGWWK